MTKYIPSIVIVVGVILLIVGAASSIISSVKPTVFLLLENGWFFEW